LIVRCEQIASSRGGGATHTAVPLAQEGFP